MRRRIRALTSTVTTPAAKLVVLAGIAFKRFIRSDAIPKCSIRPISSADFRYARRLDATIRQSPRCTRITMGSTRSSDRRSCLITSSFGRNEGANNVVSIYGRYGGESAFSGAGAGGPATAVAVVSDLLALTHRVPHGAEEWLPGEVAHRRPGPTTSAS